jgi:hypothetical protein
VKVRKLPRRINATPHKPQKSDLSISIEQSHARQIAELPKEQLKTVIDALMEGARYDDIITFFANQGWLNVTEKTFKQYLTAFKRVYPDMLKRDEDEDLNGMIDPRKPGLDPIAMAEQLVRAQSQRIRIAMNFEKDAKLTIQHTHKEIRTQRENLEFLAELRGMKQGAGRPSAESADLATNNVAAQEAMRDADKGEGAQERLVSSMGSLLDLMQKKAKRSEALSSKA